MRPRFLLQRLRVLALVLAALLAPLAARADLAYADKPLFYAGGVQPNVSLLLDTSGSMDGTDTGSFGPVTSLCNSATTVQSAGGELTRREVVRQAACQVVQDNANAMRVSVFGYASSNVNSVRDWGSAVNALKTSIGSLGSTSVGTPIVRSLYAVSKAYRGGLTFATPMQYRCQKNYVVFFTDGEPNDAQDDASSPTFATAADVAQDSSWNNSSGLYNWDGYTDAQFTSLTSGNNFYPWLDDVAQFMYDMDFQKEGSAVTRACPTDAVLANSTNTVDCANKGWDSTDYPTQNVITYVVGYGAETNIEMLRDTPLVNQVAINGSMANPTNDTLTIPAHGLVTGQYVHYYASYVDQNYNTAASASGDTLSGNTLNMSESKALTYSNGGGATLQYQEITTPAVSCGAIGGLTSGNSYYVSYQNATQFRLSTTSANAYAPTVINLTGTGTANTIHTFTRTKASAGFATTNSGTTPVNTGANIEKITRNSHGLNTGDLVTYTCTGSGCAIGGLTSGNTYYVARRSTSEFRLATSAANAATCAAANDGVAAVGTSCINLTSLGSNGGIQEFAKTATGSVAVTATGAGTTPVDTGNERITTAANHGFSTGDKVTYTCTGVPEVYTQYDIPATVYAKNVVAGNPGTFQISLTAGGTALDLSNTGYAGQTFSWVTPALQPVIPGLKAYMTDEVPDSTPNPATEDAAKGKYYVEKIDGDTIKLYSCFQYCQSPFTPVKAAFSGTDVQTASTSEYINITAHGFTTGTQVKYSCAGGCTGGLTNNSTYYVGVVNANRIRLATSAANATACATGTTGCINFTSTNTRTQFLTATSTPTKNLVDITGTTGSGYLSTGPGDFYLATDASELASALTGAFTEIRSQELSFSTLGANTSTEFSDNTRLYQARFNTSDWSGDVRTYKLTNGDIDPVPEWEASDKLPVATSRNILTRNSTNGAFAFTTANWSSLTSTQQTSLSNGGSSTVGQEVLNWTRGTDVTNYRTRVNGKLGDMLNSGLVYVGQPEKTYANVNYGLPASNLGKATYNAFKATTRTPMIYGGGNGGMLHGFEASFVPATQGIEKVAFIPEAVYMDWDDLDNDGFKDAGEAAINKFYDVARSYYGLVTGQPHHYFVNATPEAGDAYFTTAKAGLLAGSWHTVLVGGLGKGGRSVYALDVTNDTFNTSDVLWEFNDGNSGDMGYSYGTPAIALLSDGRWVAIFGNGYDSRNDQARLFIVNLESGALIQEITLGTAGSNGVASVTILNSDTTADGVTAQVIYAGDLQGNVWRVDISSSLPTSVTTPFFVAQDSSGNRQAITSPITLARYPSVQSQGVMLFFGTGSYFTNDDQGYNGTPVYDAMYGLWDKDGSSVAIGDLVEQQMGTVALDPDGDGVTEEFRTATANTVDYSSPLPKRGWYMKLAVGTDYKGERVTFAPRTVTTGSYVLFTTVIPADVDPCVGGGSSKFYALDATTGGAKSFAIFDLDNDGTFGSADDGPTGSGGVVGFGADGLASGVAVFDDNSTVKIIINDENLGVDGLNPDPPDPTCPDGTPLPCLTCPDGSSPPCPASLLKSGRMSWRQLQ